MEDKKKLFEEISVPRALGIMALPAIASQLITLVYNLADTWFVGRTNNPYMVASCSLVLPVFLITIVIANVFGVGGGTLITRLMGSGREEEATKVSSACIRMALTAASVYSLLCLLGMDPLLAYNYSSGNRKRMDSIFRFGRAVGLTVGLICVVLYYNFAPIIMKAFIDDADTVRFGTQFLRAHCFATPLMFLCFSMVHFTQAIGRGKASFILAVVRQVVFNIPILFVLNSIFGMMGIVWTQAMADLLTVIVSYIIYASIRKKEGWPAGI